MPLRGGNWHIYRSSEGALRLARARDNPQQRGAQPCAQEGQTPKKGNLARLRPKPANATKTASSGQAQNSLPTNVKLELKVKVLNLQDGPIVTNKGRHPRQTTTGPAPSPKEKFETARVYTYLDVEDTVANNHKYLVRTLKKKAGQWYEEYWLAEQDAKGIVHPGTKITKDEFLRHNPLPALQWGQGHKESEEVAWPHPEDIHIRRDRQTTRSDKRRRHHKVSEQKEA